MQHLVYILFLFALGACVGSFLNVVVWRLPQVEYPVGENPFRSFMRTWKALTWPPSHCPKCQNRLKWYDNIPVLGWIKLRGLCRFCKEPISPRYPIVEAITGLIFVLYYLLFFVFQIGPCPPVPSRSSNIVDVAVQSGLRFDRDWWVYLLYMALLSGLLAASLIDAEMFIIPAEIPYFLALVGFIVHLFDSPGKPGALNLVNAAGAPTAANALAAGAGVGLLVSVVLLSRGILRRSFPEGEPLLEVDKAALAAEAKEGPAKTTAANPGHHPHQEDKPALGGDGGDDRPLTRRELMAEMRQEMLFLMPPMALGVLWLVLTLQVGPIRSFWASAVSHNWVTGFLGSLFGALIGAFVVWVTRILGSLGFGKVAMGLGDVHLMFGVGAIVGAGAATLAFFLAPFCGIGVALWMLLTGTRREIPYGPYLSLATALVMLFYCPIADYLGPGLSHLGSLLVGLVGGG